MAMPTAPDKQWRAPLPNRYALIYNFLANHFAQECGTRTLLLLFFIIVIFSQFFLGQICSSYPVVEFQRPSNLCYSKKKSRVEVVIDRQKNKNIVATIISQSSYDFRACPKNAYIRIRSQPLQ